MDLKNSQGQNLDEFLKQYQNHDKDKYEKPSVTVDTLIFTVKEEDTKNYRKLAKEELKILLIKRKNHPHIGKWAIPGGFVRMDEDVLQSAYRELKEETNVDNVYIEQLYTWGDIERDDPRMRIISVSYMALADSSRLDINAGDDAEDAKWFSVKTELENKIYDKINGKVIEIHKLILKEKDEEVYARIKAEYSVVGQGIQSTLEIVEKNNIAFDHAKMIFYALERLKNKVEYTDIIFNLMPEYFTLTKLKKVCEIILGRDLYNAQFRRQIEPKLIKTEMIAERKGHRPAVLYKFNPLWKSK